MGSEYLRINLLISTHQCAVWQNAPGESDVPYNPHINSPGGDSCSTPVVPKVGCPRQSPRELYKVERPGSPVQWFQLVGLGAAWVWTHLKAAHRISYIICGAWFKMKTQDSLFNNYQELQDWQLGVDPSERGAQCDRAGHRLMKPGWLPRWFLSAAKVENHGSKLPRNLSNGLANCQRP